MYIYIYRYYSSDSRRAETDETDKHYGFVNVLIQSIFRQAGQRNTRGALSHERCSADVAQLYVQYHLNR